MAITGFPPNGKLYIQHDWDEAKDSAWIMMQSSDVKHYGKVHFNSSGGVKVELDVPITETIRYSKRKLSITIASLTTVFVSPFIEFSNLHGGSAVTKLAVTEELGASACSKDTNIVIWQLSNGLTLRTLEGHPFDVECVSFFPSGIVLLSGSMDLRIWSCETGACPRTFLGHKRPITDVKIVDRGKNVLSASEDGCVNLWKCSDGSTVKNIGVQSAVTCIDLAGDVEVFKSGGVQGHLGECECDGKILVAGCDDGSVRFCNLATAQQILSHQVFSRDDSSSSPCVTTCRFISTPPASPSPGPVPGTRAAHLELVCGSSSGCLALLSLHVDSPSLASLLHCHILSFSGAPVLDLALLKHKGGFVFSTQDGCVTLLSPSPSIDRVVEFTGSDCDPVYAIATNSHTLYTACRDGKVRVYGLDSDTVL